MWTGHSPCALNVIQSPTNSFKVTLVTCSRHPRDPREAWRESCSTSQGMGVRLRLHGGLQGLEAAERLRVCDVRTVHGMNNVAYFVGRSCGIKAMEHV